MPRLSLTLALLLLACIPAIAQTNDADHDGLTDDVEQRLLEKFKPTIMISSSDCAGIPARFEPGVSSPRVAALDGTLYGQVFPVSSKQVEVHYYVLWERDCGRVSHPLDAEHVAALISMEDSGPRALYWYAGAHEKTLCDMSSGARARSLSAEERGPQIWSSAGKHALYFSKAKCDSGSGCGADSCVDDVDAPAAEIINLGERNAPANGSEWLSSPGWLLSDKMAPNFTPEITRLIDLAPEDSVITVRGRSTFRGTIQVSDTVLMSAENGAQHTSSALSTADTHTTNAMGRATKATGHALRKAWHAVIPAKSADSKQQLSDHQGKE